MTPLDSETYAQLVEGKLIQEETCNKSSGDPSPKKSGQCLNRSYGTFVQKKQLDYAQYLQQKHVPLPRGKEHYPPMVSRNSSCNTVPNFSFLEFIQRLACK